MGRRINNVNSTAAAAEKPQTKPDVAKQHGSY